MPKDRTVLTCHWCREDVDSRDAVAVLTGEYAGEQLHRRCLEKLRQSSLHELRQLSTPS